MNLRFFDKFGSCLTLLTGFLLLETANAECKSFDFSASVDDFMILYVDGAPITGLRNAFNLDHVDTVTLTCATRVIAIHGINLMTVAGIRGSDSSGNILTDNSWKCTNVSYSGWEKVGFDDSKWPDAVVTPVGSNHSKLGMNPKSQWIWASSWNLQSANYRPNSNIHAYCRRKIAVNECALDPPYNLCNSTAGKCENTPTGYNCHCFNGYRNTNNQTCEDIDECRLGQQDDACTGPTELCVNLPGSYKCVSCRNNVCNNAQFQTQALTNQQNQSAPGVIILSVILVVSLLAVVGLVSYLVWKSRAQRDGLNASLLSEPAAMASETPNFDSHDVFGL